MSSFFKCHIIAVSLRAPTHKISSSPYYQCAVTSERAAALIQLQHGTTYLHTLKQKYKRAYKIEEVTATAVAEHTAMQALGVRSLFSLA